MYDDYKYANSLCKNAFSQSNMLKIAMQKNELLLKRENNNVLGN